MSIDRKSKALEILLTIIYRKITQFEMTLTQNVPPVVAFQVII